jgi:membrane protease YdiL (CAAX protease family)
MEPNTITTNTLIRVLLIIIVTEVLALAGIKLTALPYLVVLGSLRTLQIAGILWAVIRWENGLKTIKWAPADWPAGIKKGTIWSMGFAMAAGAGVAVVFMAGYTPLQWLRSPLPADLLDRTLFFIVGGLIAPIAEEICFRGVIYTYMRDLGIKAGAMLAPKKTVTSRGRRWLKTAAVVFAIAASTVIFTLLHTFHGIPVTQIVGGVVFAIAYETTRNLMTPIVIHSLGNLALFTLSLL